MRPIGVSRRIVDFARNNRATVLVFEHLTNLKPDKGKYSARSNQRRAHWLKGKIFDFAKDKAWAEGILTCRINPKNYQPGVSPLPRFATSSVL